MNYKKDALLNTIGNFSYLGALWLMSILVVRLGNFEMAGYFSLSLTTANIYISLASYTVRLYYAADIGEKFRDNQYILMRVITTGASFLLCFVGSFALGYTKYQILIILLFYVYKTLEMFSDILFGALQRHGKLYLSGYSMVLKSIVSLVFFVLCLYFVKSLTAALIAIDIVAVFVFLFYDLPMIHKQNICILPFKKEDWQASKSIMVICFPLFLVGLCYNMIPSIPRLAFERLYTAEEFGIYSSISTVTVLISTAVNCIAVPIVPKFSEYYLKRDKNGLKKITIMCVIVVLVIGGVALLGAQFFGEWLLVLLFGAEVQGYVVIFQLVIIATIFTSIIICLNDFFVAVEKQKNLLTGCITGTVICGILALPLCNKFYMNGVAYNLIISQGIEIVILLVGIRNIMKKM